MEAPQNKRFYGKMECLPIWPTYINENRRTLGKTYGIKMRFIGNTLWEHIGNLKKTCSEQMEKWQQSFLVGSQI